MAREGAPSVMLSTCCCDSDCDIILCYSPCLMMLMMWDCNDLHHFLSVAKPTLIFLYPIERRNCMNC